MGNMSHILCISLYLHILRNLMTLIQGEREATSFLQGTDHVWLAAHTDIPSKNFGKI